MRQIEVIITDVRLCPIDAPSPKRRKRPAISCSSSRVAPRSRHRCFKFAVMHNTAICRLALDLWLREHRRAICGVKSAPIRDNGDFDDPDA
jgi:hypothetical protein